MAKVAFIGLGAMGSLMVRNLLKAGHNLTVWDRKPDAIATLVAAGAKGAVSPREAATGQDFVMSMVRDDQASHYVWLDKEVGALVGMSPGAIAIESSTLSLDWVGELSRTFSGKGFALLDAMVSGSTPQAERAELVFLVGGAEQTVREAGSMLKAMGSTVQHAGPSGAGCLAKLCTNSLMASELAILAELISLLKHWHADPEMVLDAVAATTLWSPYLSGGKKSMLSGDFTPGFPIDLLLKDLSYTLKAGSEKGAFPTIEFVRSLFQKAADEGFGKKNATAIIELSRF